MQIGSGTLWSEDVSITTVGMKGVVSCPIHDTSLHRSVAVSIEFAGTSAAGWGGGVAGPPLSPGVASLTRLLRFSPRWVLTNRTDHPLRLRQLGIRGSSIELSEGYASCGTTALATAASCRLTSFI